jgi:hypothetical protein
MRGGEMKKLALVLAIGFGFLVGCEPAPPAKPVKPATPAVEKDKKGGETKPAEKAPPAPEKEKK